jgi:hypothetical protein
MVVHRTGTIPGAELRLRVIDDGQVRCNGGPKRHLPSELLIAAREIARDLNAPELAGRALPPGPRSILAYAIRTEKGLVRFSDTSPRQPRAFYRAALLARQVAKGPCGLPR